MKRFPLLIAVLCLAGCVGFYKANITVIKDAEDTEVTASTNNPVIPSNILPINANAGDKAIEAAKQSTPGGAASGLAGAASEAMGEAKK